MKIRRLIPAIVAMAALGGPLTAHAADFREHRGVYLTCVMADWPTTGLTEKNEASQKRLLTQRLDRMLAGGVNILYFAVRPYCDAAYKSQYEPWSLCVSGARGVEPPFDPLQFVIDEAHARGIEVYTLLNAYRYSNTWRPVNDVVDYRATHPEWLLVQDHETILNPCLEEVKQRVCDVAADITEHYDIDGFLFDDYYYSNPTPFDVDAEYYQAALAADPSVGTQLQWRVKNINSLIERVGKTVKGLKPWVVYGIKPAGVASPPHVRDYGLEPVSGLREGDWQYAAIAADPLYWYSHHFCDFMAPQIYWCDLFDPLQDWWVIASRKFDRHLYSAVSMSSFSDYGAAEFAREADYARTTQADNIGGIGYFRWEYYFGSYGTLDGTRMSFDKYMGRTAWNTPALAPIRHWNNVYDPAYVTGLRREGSTLTWDEVPGMRYTIYAFRAGEQLKPFNTNLVQVRYTNSFEIPADMADCTFGVAVYDRYANEYPMATEGAAMAEAVKPVLTYPADGASAADLFDFAWQPTGCDNMLEVSDSPAFETYMIKVTTAAEAINSAVVNNLEEGKTYYWRVRTNAPNAPVGVSETRSFTTSHVAVTGPSDREQSTTPRITWTEAYPGTVYKVEIGRNDKFTLVDFETETSDAFVSVPEGKLMSGFNYYARVTAMRSGRESVSEVARFSTADVAYEAPTFAAPATAGATLHSNQGVAVDSWSGLASVTLQISHQESFPARTSYKVTLKNGETSTPDLSTIKVNSKLLEDGATYYVRTAANYYVQANNSSTQTTDWRTSQFVYSAEAGVSDCVADSDAAVTISPEGILTMATYGCSVGVYTPDGRMVRHIPAASVSEDISDLPAGLYMVRVSGAQNVTLKFRL